MDGGYGSGQMPLAGAILCCTSIVPEQRTKLASIGAQMGAIIKLDLTSDVTHLIVGNIHSAKYKYVAKAREDVKVLRPEWLEALRSVWIGGDDDVDVAALEDEYRLPTFFGLRICLTGFDDPEQRKYIQDTAIQHEAEYHGDLTKAVTHLIAAWPTGKKYEHALSWGLQVVSLEWFEQSIQRGMALDEKYFHPTIAPEDRGKGAWDRRRSQSPTALGKRTRQLDQNPLPDATRRKLRRSASSRVNSQSEFLWAEITAGGSERKKEDQDDWLEDRPIRTSVPKKSPLHVQEADSNVATPPQDDALPPDPVSQTLNLPANDGIFGGRLVFTHGFDLEKTQILRDHLDNNGATIVYNPEDLLEFSSDDIRRGFLVIPHDVQADFALLPGGAGTMTRATNWWVERCLHAKSLVDPTDHVLCRPFVNLDIIGFDGLTINSTAFTGIELLQVTKAIALMGATYDEFLTTKTSVIVCNTRKPNPEKFKFATDKRIPAVHATWLWECLRTGELQPYDEYLLNKIGPRPQAPSEKQLSFTEVPTARLSEEESAKLHKRKVQAGKNIPRPHSRTALQRGGPLPLTFSTGASTFSSVSSSTHPNTAFEEALSTNDGDEGFIPDMDGSGSIPLQEINPSVNSPRRPSTKSTTSTSSNDSNTLGGKPAPTARKPKAAKEPTPDSVIPPPTEAGVECEAAAETETPPSDPNQQKEKTKEEALEKEKQQLSTIMSNLLAQRKASNQASTTNKDDDKRKQRRRQLGRAPSVRSNPSSAGDPPTRTSSASAHAQRSLSLHGESEEPLEAVLGAPGKAPYEEYQPSQELGWDAPGAQEAREKMIRALGGKVQEGRVVLKEVGVVRDVDGGGASLGNTGRGRRKR